MDGEAGYGAEPVPKHASPLLSAGWLLVIGEVYLLFAGEIALQTGEIIAPPLLLVGVWDHWLPLATVISIVCFIEFLWRRSTAARIVLALAVLIAVVGEVVELPNDASAARQPQSERVE